MRCWVSRGWSDGLTVDGHPEWPDAGHDIVDVDRGCSGLVGVLIAREHRRSRLSVCGYLVDAYCLGVKDALGPDVMDGRELAVFARHYFSAFGVPPLDAPIELARHLVHGAVEYARGLGFEPAPDFDAARGHLGPWQGPSAMASGATGSRCSSRVPTTIRPRSCARWSALSARTGSTLWCRPTHRGCARRSAGGLAADGSARRPPWQTGSAAELLAPGDIGRSAGSGEGARGRRPGQLAPFSGACTSSWRPPPGPPGAWLTLGVPGDASAPALSGGFRTMAPC